MAFFFGMGIGHAFSVRHNLRRAMYAIAFGVLAAACSNIDRLLEGEAPPTAHIAVALDAGPVTIAQGRELQLNVSVTRVGDFNGPVSLTAERLPVGVTATFENENTVGAVTTARLRLTVAAAVPPSNFVALVRARAAKLTDASSELAVTIVLPPSIALSLSANELRIARGGIARVSARIARVNAPTPVALTFETVSGVSANVVGNPIVDSLAEVTISVSPTAPAGSYPLTVRAATSGVTEKVVPLTVVIVADPIQILTSSAVSVAQAAGIERELIINRSTLSGAVSFRAEQLPVGVQAVFGANSAEGTLSTVTFLADSTAVEGTTRVVLRATANGVPDATTEVLLTIAPARITFALTTSDIEIFQGAGFKLRSIIARTSYAGFVRFDAVNAPAGLSVSGDPTRTTGDTALLTFSATSAVAPGNYSFTVRAIPEALKTSAAATITVNVVVRPASAGAGNVLVTWLTCAPPTWFAAQDGNGAWQQVQPSAGTYRFSIATNRGGYAYAENGTNLTVRYLSNAELTGATIDMCPPRYETKTVRGVGAHSSIGETWTYQMGGGVAQSTTASPNFVMADVRPGSHDLVSWIQSVGLYRGIIRRDLNIPNGESVGAPLNLNGPESFTSQRVTMNLTSGVLGNEALNHSMAYLTTAQCTESNLYTSTNHGSVPNVYGVPEQFQQPTDFHLLKFRSATSFQIRTLHASFKVLTSRSFALPPVVSIQSLAALPGPFKRLRVTLGQLPTAYNSSTELRYSDGARFMTVIASNGYTGSEAVVVEMPDLSVVPNFPSGTPIPSTGAGSWNVILSGESMSGSLCTENRITTSITRLGTFQ